MVSQRFKAARGTDAQLLKQFEEHIEAFHNAPWRDVFSLLAESRVDLPPPDTLSDEQVTTVFWRLLRVLAHMHVYVHRTDHLSDREVYAWLWSDALREAAPVGLKMNRHLDPLGSGDEASMAMYLRYYADDAMRHEWQTSFPGDVLPERERPPHDRDRLLPKPELNPAGDQGDPGPLH